METELFTMNDSELDSSTIKNKQANKNNITSGKTLMQFED